MLDFNYTGVTFTSTTSALERFTYNVTLDDNGTGELWIRHNALLNRIDLADNPTFAGTGSGVPVIPVKSLPSPIPGPFSLGAITSPGIKTKTWSGEEETFFSGELRITSFSPGTKVYLANGDPFPLGLNVSLAGPGSEINIRGPINTLLNVVGGNEWSTNISLAASRVTVEAEMTSGARNPLPGGGAFGVNLRGGESIELRNKITNTGSTPGIVASVDNGDFWLVAGGSIIGTTSIFVGEGKNSVGGDIRIDGSILAQSLTMQVRSAVQPTSILTGPSGIVSGGGSLTLFNAGLDGGLIDIRTKNYSVTNVNVGGPTQVNPDIGIAIDQTAGNLVIAAVPSSRGQISLKASGPDAEILINADINTQAGLALEAGVLSVKSGISTVAGNVQLTGDTVTVSSNVTAGKTGVGNVIIKSRTGAVSLTSAAVVRAPGESIVIDAKTSISSSARLEAELLDVTAGQGITLESDSRQLRARAGTGVNVSDLGDLSVRSALTTSGPISISTKGQLDVVAATVQGSGAITLAASGGLRARDVRTKNGLVDLSTRRGDVVVIGAVTAEGAEGGLSVAADQGNIIFEPTASVSVVDLVRVAAPNGRVLTPGSVTGVVMTSAGTGYTTPPTVSFEAGGGAVANPVIAAGGVSGIQITNGGSGYVTAPSVKLVSTDGNGVNAQAQAFLDASGSVTRIAVTNPGIGYTSAPTVVLSGGSGSLASARAQINGVSAIDLTSGGSGYLVPPQVVISAGDGAVAAPVSVNATGGITKINLSAPGAEYGVAPSVEIFDTSGSGSGAVAVATLSSGVTGINLQTPGSGYSAPPVVTIAPPSGPGGRQATAEAIISGGVKLESFTIPSGQGGTGYSTGVRANVIGDGRNAAATVTISGEVSSITLAGGKLGSGSLYATEPTVTLRGGTTPASARALLGLTSDSFTVVDPGIRLYTGVVQVNFSQPTESPGRLARGEAILGPTGSITGITITDAGAGYSAANPPTIVSFSGSFTTPPPGPGVPPSSPPTTTFNPGFFTVGAIDLTAPGSGYTFNPPVVIGPSPAGTNAAATAQIRGTITSVTIVDGGEGFTTTPTLQFTDPAGGSGAVPPTLALTASVIGVRVLDSGTGYTTTPAVTIAPGATAATASAIRSQVVSGITVKNSGANYNPATTTVRLVPVAGGAGAVAGAVTVDSAGVVTAINLAASGRDYVAPPRVIINDTSGAGSGAEFSAIVDTNPASPTYRQITGFNPVSGGRGYNPETTTVTILSAGSGATAVANLDLDPQSLGFGKISSISVLNSGSGYESGAGAPLVRIVPFGSGAEATAALSAGGVASVSVTKGGSNYAVPPKVVFSGGGGNNDAAGTAIISNVATINADRLSWTAVAPPLDALASQFRALDITLTAPGDLVLERASGTLVIEGARTKDGSISIKAPGLSVTGPVIAGDFSSTRNRTILLEAAADNLVIDAAVGGLLPGTTQPIPLAKTVTLRAPTGSITTTRPTPGLVTADLLSFRALDKALIETNVFTVRGGTTAAGSDVTLAQRTVGSDGNVLPMSLGDVSERLFATNGSISVTAGDKISVYEVDAGAAGTVSLAAVGGILGKAAPGLVQVLAGKASLKSDTDQIVLVTKVAEVSAEALLSTIDIDNLATDTLTLGSIGARRGARIRTQGDLVAPSITVPSGPISLETVQPNANIKIGSLSAVGFPVTVTAGGAIRQIDPNIPSVKAASATFRSTDSLDLYLDAGVITAIAANDISLRNDAGMTVDLESLAGGNITLRAGGVLSQNAPIKTTGLLDVASTGGDIVLGNAGNNVGGFTARNPGRNVTYRDSGTLRIAAGGTDGIGLEATNVDLTGGTGLAQDGAIKASTILAKVTGSGGVNLTSPNNVVTGVSGSTVNGDFRFVNSSAFSVAAVGVTAGTASPTAGNGNIVLTALSGSLGILGNVTAISDTITLQAPNGTIIQQAGTIRTYTPPAPPAGTLRWTAATQPTFTSVVTGNVITDIGGNVNVGVPGQDVTVPETFTSAGNITIVGRNITIVGPVTTQSGRITVTSTGTVSFLAAGVLSASDVVFSAANSSQLVLGANVPIANASLASGTLTLSSRGVLRQTGPITAPFLVAAAGSGGAVNLTHTGNKVGVFSAQAPHAGGNVVFQNAGTFTVGGTGITAGTASAGDGIVSLAALSGNLTVTSPITAIADTVELRAQNGVVTVSGLVTSQNLIIIDSRGGSVRDPFRVSNAQGLAETLAIINSLPAIAGTTYEIVVANDITLTQPLTVSRPVKLMGTAPGIRINGSNSSPNGFTFDAGASGSQVRNLVFDGFQGTAVQLLNARNVTVQDIWVQKSGTGLFIQGSSTGTSIQSSGFIANTTAISLDTVQGATLGGATPPNIISGGVTGVFATGISTGSMINGLVFDNNPATITPFNVGTSRQLAITGTVFTDVNPIVPDRPVGGVGPPAIPGGRPPSIDLNASGLGDLIWTNGGTGAVAWLDGNPNTFRTLSGGAGSTLITTGDFNGDGVTDLVWKLADGRVLLQLQDASGGVSSQGIIGGGNGNTWSIVAAADYSGDGKSDLIWWNSVNGNYHMWHMDGLKASKTAFISRGASDWKLVPSNGRFDVNGSGRTDLLWTNTQTGVSVVWLLDQGGFLPQQVLRLGSSAVWEIVATGDFDGDGRGDLIWRNRDTGIVSMWLLDYGTDGRLRANTRVLGNNSAWEIADTMDTTGNGRSEIFWRNLGNGAVVRWNMNGMQVESTTSIRGGSIWRLLGRPGASA